MWYVCSDDFRGVNNVGSIKHISGDPILCCVYVDPYVCCLEEKQ